MKTIPQTIYPRDSHVNIDQRIPKIIYQTFKSKSVPDNFYDNFLSYVDNNPEYHYEFYDDQRLQEYVYNYNCSGLSFTNDELRMAFDSIAVPAGCADLWRYLIIYEKGGVYVDFDTRCIQPLKNLIDINDDIVTCRIGQVSNYRAPGSWKHLFPQWMLIYSAKNEIMKAILETAVKCIITKYPVPDSIQCLNLLERITGVCISNYIYRKKVFKFDNLDQEDQLKGIKFIEYAGYQYQLHIHPFVNFIVSNTIKEKFQPILPLYYFELEKIGMTHWSKNKNKIWKSDEQ